MLHSSLQGTVEEEESNITSDLLNAQSNSQSRQNSHQLTSRLPVLTSIDHTALDNDALHAMVRSQNEQQRLAFDTVLTWCRSVTKSTSTHEQVHSLQLFITGGAGAGAGAGKSHLIKTLYHTAVNTFRQISQNPEKPYVLLLAPTGIAAINIKGTINSGLSIPVDNFGYNVTPLSDIEKSAL